MNSCADTWSLARLQTWLRLVTTDPGGVRQGSLHARKQCGEGLPVRVPAGVLPGDRLAIYARGYLDRLLSCLRADFPALRALLGEEMFDTFALGYLQKHPPRHYSLFALGARFAEHLEDTCPAQDAVPHERRALLRLPIDLARIERARLEVTREIGHEGLNPWANGANLALLLGHDLLVSTSACLRVIELHHDVRAFLCAIDRGETPTTPEPHLTTLAVSRADYRIVFSELSGWQQRVLARCVVPTPLLELAQDAAASSGETRGALLAELSIWLPSAAALGMISLQSR